MLQKSYSLCLKKMVFIEILMDTLEKEKKLRKKENFVLKSMKDSFNMTNQQFAKVCHLLIT